MRHLCWMVLLAACGGTPPNASAPTGSGHSETPGSGTGSATAGESDPGQVAVAGDTVTLTLTGVKSVSTEPCRDLVGFAIEDGGKWIDLAQTVHDKMYWLDGKQVGPSMCDYSPCHSQMAGGDDVALSAPLTGFRRTGERDGLPEYQTTDVRGDVRVTFSYSLDGCATFRTFTATIHR